MKYLEVMSDVIWKVGENQVELESKGTHQLVLEMLIYWMRTQMPKRQIYKTLVKR